MSYGPKVYRKQGGNELVIAAGGTLTVETGANITGPSSSGPVYQKRVRATAAEVNAGLTVLAAVPGFKYRIIDFTMVAIGGNAGTATSVDLAGIQATNSVRLAVVAVAALTRSTAVKPNSANVTILADGAGFVACDANSPVVLTKQSGGGDLATATHIDLILQYTMEK